MVPAYIIGMDVLIFNRHIKNGRSRSVDLNASTKEIPEELAERKGEGGRTRDSV